MLIHYRVVCSYSLIHLPLHGSTISLYCHSLALFSLIFCFICSCVSFYCCLSFYRHFSSFHRSPSQWYYNFIFSVLACFRPIVYQISHSRDLTFSLTPPSYSHTNILFSQGLPSHFSSTTSVRPLLSPNNAPTAPCVTAKIYFSSCNLYCPLRSRMWGNVRHTCTIKPLL